MSNVLFVCSEPNCGARLFAASTKKGIGGKSKIHCPQHTDKLFVQAEQYYGPNFELISPEAGKDKTKGQTHIQTGGVDNISIVTETPLAEEVSDEEKYTYYIKRYRMLYNEEPDKRWKLATLRTKVQAEEDRQEEKTKAEFAAKKRAAGEIE